MKRLIAFFILIVLLIGVKFINNDFPQDFKYEKIVVITKSQALFDGEYIKNGNQYYYTFDYENTPKFEEQDIDGVVYYFNSQTNINKIKQSLNFCYQSGQDIDNMKIYYGWTNKYQNFRIVNNKKVNVQIVENSTNIIVGFPMILCGY